MSKTRFVRRLAACLACAAVSVVGVQSASAGGGPIVGLVDVSKQLAKIQATMSKAIASSKAAIPTGPAACNAPSASPLFAAWGDTAMYSLAPQGDLETIDQWSFNSNVSLSVDHDPFSGVSRSLLIKPGGQAASPVTCLTIDNPTIRFFAKTDDPRSTLAVSVLYKDAKGNPGSLTVANLGATANWAPSIVVPIYLNGLAALTPTGTTAVAFQFSTNKEARGSWQIDGIFVDPFTRR